ncbi:MAG: type II toxin-antitoxin system death-on-curing family toxin [Patescibacteria group bacterium]
MPKIQSLSVAEVEYLAHSLARKLMSFDEPIPAFTTRYPDKLESCLATPFQQFSRLQLYPGLLGKAAMVFYLMIKNHPFQNGNKRIAVTALLVLLYKNRKWIRADTTELYNFAVWIAESPAKLKNETVAAVARFLKLNVVDR